MKIDLIDLINLISKKAPIGKLGFRIYLGQLEIRIIRNFVALLIVCLAISFIPSPTNAESIDLGVYPPIIQINAQPPASVSTGVSIENFRDQEVTLDIGFKRFKPTQAENGDLEYIDEETLPSVFEYMQVLDNGRVVNRIVLSPKQKKDLVFHIGLLEKEKPSDYYFSILFVSQNPTTVGSTQSQAIAVIGTNVLLTVGPTGPTLGKIEEFSAPFFVAKGPVEFKARISNLSDHYITPSGIITIKDVFGKTVGKIDLLSVNVLSQSTRIMPGIKEESVENPKASWNQKFLLGPYTARLTVGLSEKGPIYHKTATFFAFPIELLAGTLISIAIVALIVKRVRSKQKEN